MSAKPTYEELEKRVRELERTASNTRQYLEASQENEQKFRAAFEGSHDAITLTTKEGTFLDCNQRALELFGLQSKNDLFEKRPADLSPPLQHDGRPSVETSREFIDKVFREGNAHRFEWLHQRKTGEVFPAEVILTPVRIGNQEVLQASIRDITDRKRAAEALQQAAEKYCTIINTTIDGFWQADMQGRFVDVNDAYCRLTGYSSEELLNMSIADIEAIENPEATAKRIQRIEETGFDRFETRHRRKDGMIVDVEISVNYLATDGGRLFVFVRDITGRKNAEKALRESEEKYRSLFENVVEGIFQTTPDGRFLSANPFLANLLGFDSPWELTETLTNLGEQHYANSEDREKFKKILETKGFVRGFETRLLRKDGGEIWASLNARAVKDDEGSLLYYEGTLMDITDRKRAEEKIHQMAYYDSLTGLPNRVLFCDRLSIAMAQARRNQRRVAVSMLDLDHFKEVNDTLGHDVGDLLLKAAADRLSAALRKSDTVARFGGDEFVLMIPGLKEVDDLIPVARKIVESFRKPFLIGGYQLFVTTSMGIAVHPDDGTTENILLKNADSAMYQAKRTGRNRYHISNKG
ncbi:MAG: PAS domain S-box protein [Thermodesulfobacteriota bacterium]